VAQVSAATKLAGDLRDLAAFVESHPLLAEHLNSTTMLCWAHSRADLEALLTELGPSGSSYANDTLVAHTRRFGAADLRVAAYLADIETLGAVPT
jgi:hypothetical protein